jgi:hypothetical protein
MDALLTASAAILGAHSELRSSGSPKAAVLYQQLLALGVGARPPERPLGR